MNNIFISFKVQKIIQIPSIKWMENDLKALKHLRDYFASTFVKQ